MKAKIITTGDEIMIGQVIDTNSAWISARLNDIGVKVSGKSSIGDSAKEIADEVDSSLAKYDVVIITGGIGPTKDDITKKTLAALFGCEMKRDEASYRHIEAMLKERGLDFNELNQGQALLPECCQVLTNWNGTAPGMWFQRGEKVLVSLPGVPFEMRELMENEVLPRLVKQFSIKGIVHKTVATAGIAESVLAERLDQWEESLPDWLRLAYLPGTAGVRLRLSAYDVDVEVTEKQIDIELARLHEIIPENLLENGATTVQAAVAGLLTARGETVAVAESCTGGEIASRFTQMAGASAYFSGGVVAYNNCVKHNVLGVAQKTLDEFGAVSRQVVEQMAQGVRELMGSDYGVATTGVAGPSGGTKQEPVGLVWMAVASRDGVVSIERMYGKLREQNIDRASTNAINLLRGVVKKGVAEIAAELKR